MSTGSKTLFDNAMELQASDIPNVRQAVPFFNVKDIEASLRFYVDGLAFTMTRKWTPEGRIRWCLVWVTSFTDPDGYRLDFESPTDIPEETVYSDLVGS